MTDRNATIGDVWAATGFIVFILFILAIGISKTQHLIEQRCTQTENN